MQLRDLLNSIGVTQTNIPDVRVGSLCCDTRQLDSHCLFFALPGTNVDGSEYIAEALKGGASAVVSEDNRLGDSDSKVFIVENARQALSRAATAFYGCPSSSFYLNGVTGTNGKTTLTYLLERIWGLEKSGVMGTVNVRYAGQILPATHTTPDPIQIQKIFSTMRDHVDKVSIEVSSHALDQERVGGCEFDSAVFTNLTQDHLDYHQSMEEYYLSKRKLFLSGLAQSSKKDKLAVINRDDDYGQRLIADLQNAPYQVQTFSSAGNEADISLLKAEYTIQGTKAWLKTSDGEIVFSTNLIGEHNLKNIMAAALVGQHSGLKMDQILKKLSQVSVPGRLDRVLSSNFFVDYAHTPDALENVLSAVKKIMNNDGNIGRLIAVFGCGGDRDRKKRPLMGGVAAKWADVSLVTSDNPRTEDPELIVKDILPGVEAVQSKFDGTLGYLVEVDRRQALKRAVELAGVNDVVVVAGKGHEDYQIIGTKKIHFDDREILTEFLG